MTNEELKQKVLTLASNAEFSEGKEYLTATIPSGKLHSIAKALKDSEDTSFDYLFCLSAVDYGDNFGVVYHLESTKHRHCLVLKVLASSKENPVIETVCDIWKTADFHEREAYDLMGVVFKNHPDMRRIFLDENWVGHPLRKDYSDDINVVER